MEQHSLEQVNPSSVKHFFGKLCLVTGRYAKKHHAVNHLQQHLDQIKKHPVGKKLHPKYVKELKLRINDVLDAERKISSSGTAETFHERELNLKVEELEQELRKTRGERDKAVGENKENISDISAALLSIKKRLNVLIQAEKPKKK